MQRGSLWKIMGHNGNMIQGYEGAREARETLPEMEQHERDEELHGAPR